MRGDQQRLTLLENLFESLLHLEKESCQIKFTPIERRERTSFARLWKLANRRE